LNSSDERLTSSDERLGSITHCLNQWRLSLKDVERGSVSLEKRNVPPLTLKDGGGTSLFQSDRAALYNYK